MNIGILGSGRVGQTIAAKLMGLGHDTMIGTRDVKALMARTAPDGMGNPPFAAWHKQHADVQVGTFAQAAAHGALLVNATAGTGAIEALQLAGEKNLAGKVLIDISNPLDFSKGMPPSLFVANTDSLAELIQRTFPGLKVVKTLNTMTAALMVNPQLLADGNHTVFVCGDDAAAKAQVADILTNWFGWQDVIDLGDLSGARATEMLLPIWVRLFGVLQTPMVAIKVVR